MTDKKPKKGRSRLNELNNERLNRVARIKAARPGISSSTAANRAHEEEAETTKHPTDAGQLRALWKREESEEKAKGFVGPDGEWVWTHPRIETALLDEARKMGLTPVLIDGKLSFPGHKRGR